MTNDTLPGGTYDLGDLEVTRFGYGAMQLAGPQVFGPAGPPTGDEAVRVLRTAVELGIPTSTRRTSTAHVTNEIIREALHPYAEDLHIVTKVGSRREREGAVAAGAEARAAGRGRAREPRATRARAARRREPPGRRVDAPEAGSIAPQFEALAELRQQGLIRHLGLSTVTAAQLLEALRIAPVVCVQNMYNVAQRADDDLVDLTAAEGIASCPTSRSAASRRSSPAPSTPSPSAWGSHGCRWRSRGCCSARRTSC